MKTFLLTLVTFAKLLHADLITYPSLQGHLLALPPGLYAGYADYNFLYWGITEKSSVTDKNLAHAVGCRDASLSAEFKFRISKDYIEAEKLLGRKGPKLYSGLVDYVGNEWFRIKDVVSSAPTGDVIQATFQLETQTGAPAGYDIFLSLRCFDSKYKPVKISFDHVSKPELPAFFQAWVLNRVPYKADHTLPASDTPASLKFYSSFRDPFVFSFKKKEKLAVQKKGDTQKLCVLNYLGVTLTFTGASSTEPIYTDPNEIDRVETISIGQYLHVPNGSAIQYSSRLDFKANFSLSLGFDFKKHIPQPLPTTGGAFMDAVEKSARETFEQCGWFQWR